MKKIFVVILSLISLIMMVLGVSCKKDEAPIEQPHVHTWAQSFEKDEQSHWQVCVDCGQINGEKTNHDYSISKSDGEYQWLECECGAQGRKSLIETWAISASIKFKNSSEEMLVGEQLDLRASGDFSCNYQISYSSNNQSVATVDQSGLVTARASGQTVIKASYGEVYATCIVNVSHGQQIPQLKTQQDSFALMKGDTLTITPYILFNGVRFTNANISCYVQDDCVDLEVININGENVIEVGGLEQGNTTITLKAEWDGFVGLNTLEKQIQITVKPDFSFYVNNGATSNIVLYNKSLPTIYGTTPTAKPLLITASGEIQATEVIVEDQTLATYDAENNMLVGTGKVGQTNITIQVTDALGNVHTQTLPFCCYPAVGDYLSPDGSDYASVEIDTLSGEIDSTLIFGKQVTITRGYVGRTPLEIVDNKIIGGLEGQVSETPNPVTITLYSEDEGYNVKVIPYLLKGIEKIDAQYNYSCETGEFFTDEFILCDLANELGQQELTKAYLVNEDEQIKLAVKEGKITDLSIKEFPENYSLALGYNDRAVLLDVTAYTLIIDQMQDFAYFTVYEGQWTYHRAFMWKIAYDVMEWDGYYVLANDLDATTYDHKGLEAPYYHLSWDNVNIIPGTFESGGAVYACVDDKDAYGLFGKGFLGTFDGRGHVIDGYKPNSGGLFQALNGAYIKDLGFTNVKLSSTTGILSGIAVGNTVVDNVFVQVDPNYSYGAGAHTSVLTSSVSRRVTFKNVIVINETTNKSSNTSSILGGEGNYSAYGVDYSNVHVISSLPIFFKYNSGNDTITALYESEYIDGEKTDYNLDYEVNNITPGVYRWSSSEIMKENLTTIKQQAFEINDWIWDLLEAKI